ncbi:hypothetical protein A2U01_0088167, partial [Trifolium medium]|nr:hypothetical protein [Trifolium medium]
YPSTSTHTPTHDDDDDDADDDDERPGEVPNYPEDLADLSDEDHVIVEIFDNDNDHNDDEDNDDDDERNQVNAYNPPSHMRNLD